ncbi:hypothetical protein K523DRAFT_370479 [Schizophyllum commune Tattone D]|nr:hypothetical protein K523DRAFT_370479 [Schizophyllum commune Tattone D]
MVNNTNYNHQSPEGIIDPAVFDALMNGAGGGNCDAWGYEESASHNMLDNGYTGQQVVGNNQRWDGASFGMLSNDPQSQLTGQAGFQQSSLPAQDVARAIDLAFPFSSLPPVPPPIHNYNYEGRHDLKAPWEYGDHTTSGEFEESTVVPSRSNTHTIVPSGGSNSNSGTSATLVELGPVNGLVDHAPSTDDNNELQKDTKKDKGKDLAVEDTPTPPSKVEHWIGAVDTTTQASPNQSPTPPHEFLASGDFNNVDGSALVVAGLTIPEDSALYRRRAVGAEFVPPPFDMNGASGMRRLPAPAAVRTHPATTSTAPEPSAFARRPYPTDPCPPPSPSAIANAGPASSSRTPQAPAPSSKKRKAADSGTGAPAKKQSHHDKKQSRQDKHQSHPRRPKDSKTSAKKHKHAQAGHEYFTLTHSNWILRLPTEDGAAQAGSTSSTGTSSSDEAPVENASLSNDASASAQNGDDFVQGDEPVTSQHAAWHSKQGRPIVQQAPCRFGRESDLRRRAQYGPDTLARIERENAATATSSSSVLPNGSALPNASSSSSPPLDVGLRGHGGRRHGDVTTLDRAPVSNTKDGSNEAALAGPSPAIASAPTSSSMRSGSQAMQLPLEEPMAATSSRLDDSLQSPHYMVSHQPPHTYQQYAPPQYAPAGWYAHSYEMPQPYDAPPNPYMTPTVYPPPAPHSWSYSPPAGLHAPFLNPGMIGNIHYYPHYEQGFCSASNQDPSHDNAPPFYDPSYGRMDARPVSFPQFHPAEAFAKMLSERAGGALLVRQSPQHEALM